MLKLTEIFAQIDANSTPQENAKYSAAKKHKKCNFIHAVEK